MTPFRQNIPLQIMVGLYALAWIAFAIEPLNRWDWFLENLLVVAFVPTLVVSYRSWQFSNLSYALIMCFLLVHGVGAHYAYEVPLTAWLQSGFDLSRNHYDRIVHFSYGLFLTYPCFEWLRRSTRTDFSAAWFALCMILGTSALYEMIEMWTAMIVDPDLGIAFVGAQGDVWDAQKDMALAMFGGMGVLSCMQMGKWWRKGGDKEG